MNFNFSEDQLLMKEEVKKLMKQAQKPGFANKIKSLLGGNQMPTID